MPLTHGSKEERGGEVYLPASLHTWHRWGQKPTPHARRRLGMPLRAEEGRKKTMFFSVHLSYLPPPLSLAQSQPRKDCLKINHFPFFLSPARRGERRRAVLKRVCPPPLLLTGRIGMPSPEILVHLSTFFHGGLGKNRLQKKRSRRLKKKVWESGGEKFFLRSNSIPPPHTSSSRNDAAEVRSPGENKTFSYFV